MAKLKAILKELTEVDEKYRELYEMADDGTFALSTDHKDTLDEFRSNNRALKKKSDELATQLEKFKDVDPEKYQKAMAAWDKLQQSEEARLIADGKLDEVLTKRTEAMKRDYTTQVEAKTKALNEITQERDVYRSKLSGLTIDQEVQRAVGKVGNVRKGALDDVLYRARNLWALDEKGNVLARRNGEAVYGKDGDPLKMEEWAQRLLEDAPHLFESGQGGGGGGGKRGDGEGGNARSIPAGDPLLFGKNLEDIAKGKVTVR